MVQKIRFGSNWFSVFLYARRVLDVVGCLEDAKLGKKVGMT